MNKTIRKTEHKNTKRGKYK